VSQFEQSATTTASHDTAKTEPLKKNTSLIPSFTIVEPVSDSKQQSQRAWL